MVPLRAGRFEAGLGALLHHLPLVFRERAEHLHHHPPGGHGRIDHSHINPYGRLTADLSRRIDFE
jgi:hypothetical protein